MRTHHNILCSLTIDGMPMTLSQISLTADQYKAIMILLIGKRGRVGLSSVSLIIHQGKSKSLFYLLLEFLGRIPIGYLAIDQSLSAY